MRGNTRGPKIHGPAAIGALRTPAGDFDGLHFTDLNQVLHGHPETAPAECRDDGLRAGKMQLNDEGSAYVDGKILLVMREFRNRQQGYPKFSRLVFGLYDPAAGRWTSNVAKLVDWST